MKKKIDYTQLAGTLFIPATHKDLDAVILGMKYPNLKSVLIDLEDSVDDVELSMKNLQQLLNYLEKKIPLVFIRPRDATSLKNILDLKHIQRVDGFILPKFTLSNADAYLTLLKDKDFSFMPSIEGSELFDPSKLIELKDILLPYKEKIILIRYGLEDMLRQLGMRRRCDESIFDFASTSVVLGNLIATFKGAGFAISGGVYPYFRDDAGFIKDVKKEMREGLFSKTIIHPNQITVLNELYKVSEREFDEALAICFASDAVFGVDGKMVEKTTMTPHSLEVIKRALVYGLR
ncbi:MAG: HpcH/HpaI aldolase/citrate lyase family protein [Campylobacterales bacterium]|nr:HpcH/HpaI aldolase/citrate lyase family protein [Campylobacterales bacterium]